MTTYNVADLPCILQKKIAPNTDTQCWEWTAARQPTGYGWVGFGGRGWRAHRLVYTLLAGEIPTDLVLDHLCRVKHCVNPGHLEAVPQYENVRRGLKGRNSQACDADMALAVVLAGELEARGWTHAEFAAKTGLAPSIIRTRLAGNSTFMVPEVFDFARALGIRGSELFRRAEVTA